MLKWYIITYNFNFMANKLDKSNNVHFIQAQVSSYADSRCDLAPQFIKEKYDYEIQNGILQSQATDDSVMAGIGYNLLYQYILKYKGDFPNDKIVTVGGDSSIIASTIPAINESYMTLQGQEVVSKLKVLIIDAEPNLHNESTFNNACLNRMSMGSVMGIMEHPLAKFKLLLDTNQIIYMGLRDIDDTEEEILSNMGIIYFDMKKINVLGINNVIKTVKEYIGSDPLHLSVSMKGFDPQIAPSVTTKYKNGLSYEDMIKITKGLSPSVVSLDVVEFDAAVGTEREKRLTGELCRQIISNSVGIKEKSLNIFNEDSEFLIFRPMSQEAPTDYGWYILKEMDIETKLEILKNLKSDQIISLDIDGTDYLITKTTMNEQNERSCFTSQCVQDMALFPEEKQSMVFELIS